MTALSVRWRIPLLLCVVALLAACASKPDTRYRDSVDGPPLAIPAGLDTPAWSRAMEIPAARATTTDGIDDDIEKPPSLRQDR